MVSSVVAASTCPCWSITRQSAFSGTPTTTGACPLVPRSAWSVAIDVVPVIEQTGRPPSSAMLVTGETAGTAMRWAAS